MIVSVKVYSESGEEVAILVQGMGVYQMPLGLETLIPSFVPDSGGQALVRMLGPGTVLAWNGANNSGQLVGSGTYHLRAEVRDAFGRSETWTEPLTVIRTSGEVLVEIFSGAGELVWTETRPYSPLSNASGISLGLSESAFVPGAGSLKVSYGRNAGDEVFWDGLNGQGRAVNAGTYLVQVSQRSPEGAARKYSAQVTVLQLPSEVFGSLLPSQNPLPSGAGRLTLSLQGALPGTLAWGRVYNLAGELVGQLGGSAPALNWDPAPGLSSGVYHIQVTAENSLGMRKGAVVKIAVFR